MASILVAILPAGFAIAAVPALTPINIARPLYQAKQPGSLSPIKNAASPPQCFDSLGNPTTCNGATMLQVSYFGGKVIPNAKVYAVFWTSAVDNTTQTGIGSFYQAITNSAWMDWLTEYSTLGLSGGSNQAIGRGTYAGAFTITPTTTPHTCVRDSTNHFPPPGSTCIWDTDIAPAELDAQINAGNLPMPDQHTLYMFHFPPTYVIQSFDRTNKSDSCVQYCAFHSTYTRTGFGSVYYSVLPDLGASGCLGGCGGGTVFDNLCSAASHELGESMTDAEVGLATALAPPLSWYDGAPISQGEIGDMCNQSTDTLTVASYTVQNLFSKVVWDAGLHDPSTPACVSTRFATNDYDVFFNPNTKSLASGENASIPIHVETTNGANSLVTLTVSSLSNIPTGVHASPSQTSVTSVPPGSAAVANLNITVDPGTQAAADLVVVLSATSGSVVHSASVLLQIVPATPTPTSNSPVCVAGTINLMTQTVAGATYAWTGPNSFTSSQQNPTIPNATAANAGMYSVTVTVNKRTSDPGTTNVIVSNSTDTPVIAAPANAVTGATGLTASVASHEGSTYAWSITNGTITGGQGTNQITFTAGVSGSVNLAVIETRCGSPSPQATASVPIIGPPQSLIATASSGPVVAVSWLANGGAPTYEVLRRGPGGSLLPIGTTTNLFFNDTNAVADTAYLYAVRGIDSVGNRTSNSNVDLATTTMFTDDPLVAQLTAIKVKHITDLRTAVNAVRKLAGLLDFAFTDPVLDSTVLIKIDHVIDLRTALDEARANPSLALPTLTYAEVLMRDVTPVRTTHLRELRDGVK